MSGMSGINIRALPLLALLLAPVIGHAGDRFGVEDISRLADVAEPAASPDSRWLVYSVTTTHVEADLQQSDLWRVAFSGGAPTQLTHTPEQDEWAPSYSPDGRWIAFLSDRGAKDATTQLWRMPAGGGEAEKLTDFTGGVQEFDWAPDSQRLAVIARDPEFPADSPAPKTAPPIVITRYQFKDDAIGYLTDRRQHLYVFDIANREVLPLTTGANDEYLPSWSPDGHHIAYVTKRGADPDRHINYDIYLIEPRAGASERQLTTHEGADLDPYAESRPEWSPDSRQIAYLQSGPDREIYYAPWQLAVIDVASGASRLPAAIDRFFFKPRFSADGRSVLALVEQSRVTHLSRINLATGALTPLTTGLRFDADFAEAPDGRIAVLGGDDQRPYELAAIDRAGLRTLTHHNAFLDAFTLAQVRPIFFKSADGTPLEGFVVTPPDYVAGKRYPTILRIHGGPVYQYSHEFLYDWQAYAAAGFVVVAANPRGSSGRGHAFARAIYADWGHLDVADVLAAVDHVVELGIADPDRLGVGGRSYGGILTNYVIASDKRFKAAVSGAGESNVLGLYGHDQYTREYEFELGLPWTNADAWIRSSYPLLKADRITTPTHFYCAEKDENVPCLGSEQMYQALRSLDVPTALVIYPGEDHAMVVPSYLRDRLTRDLAWNNRYLKSATAP